MTKNTRKTLGSFESSGYRDVEYQCRRILADELGLPMGLAETLVTQVESVMNELGGISSNALWIPEDMFIRLANKKYPSFLHYIDLVRKNVAAELTDNIERQFQAAQDTPYETPFNLESLYEQLGETLKTLDEREQVVLSMHYGLSDG